MMKEPGRVNGHRQLYSRHAMSVASHPHKEPQSAGSVLMVRPAGFGSNPQTAASNAFQSIPSGTGAQAHAAAWQAAALSEFDALAQALQGSGVDVHIAEDSVEPVKPDAIFPNNWVSFHHDGSVVLYPMLAPNRRLERREEILGQVIDQTACHVSRIVDLTHWEDEGKYLEGTGSVVLDRSHHVAYACTSPRTDLDVLGAFARELDYELVNFDAIDAAGRAVYHTNVVMAVGGRFAVVCGAAIIDPKQRGAVFTRLSDSGHVIVDITLAQMAQFAGNVLELTTPKSTLIALSSTALYSFDPAQRRVLEELAQLVPVPVPTIEHIGGGGVRCMLAEIHLPKRV